MYYSFQFSFYVILLLNIGFCNCFKMLVPSEPKETFQTVWQLIKSKLTLNSGSTFEEEQARLKMDYKMRYTKYFVEETSTTERTGYMLEIPILPAPKSKYQYLYRMDAPIPKYELDKVSHNQETHNAVGRDWDYKIDFLKSKPLTAEDDSNQNGYHEYTDHILQLQPGRRAVGMNPYIWISRS